MSTTEKILEKQYFNVKDDIQQQTKFKKKIFSILKQQQVQQQISGFNGMSFIFQ